MQTQIFNREFIFERIKDSGFPFWSLGLSQGFKNTVNVMQYYGADFEDEDTDDTKIEKSLTRLANTIATFPPESVFVIEIKNSKQANGSGVVGPFLFNNDNDGEDDNSNQNPQLGQIPAGYIPESMLKGLEDKIKSEFETKLENYKLETERKQRESDFRRREDALVEREKEVKDLEKAYNSSVAKTADVFIEIGKKIALYFFPPTAETVSSQPPQPQLSGAVVTPPPVDEKTKAVDDLAEFVYKNMDKDSIIKLKENLINLKNANTLVENANPNAANAANGNAATSN